MGAWHRRAHAAADGAGALGGGGARRLDAGKGEGGRTRVGGVVDARGVGGACIVKGELLVDLAAGAVFGGGRGGC